MPRNNRMLIIIFLLAVVIRLVYVTEQKKNPLFTYPVNDPAYNLYLAETIINDPSSIPPVFIRPPLYSFFLAFTLRVFHENLFAPRFFQCLMSAFSVLIAVRIGQMVFSRTAGIIAGLLLAFYWPLIFFTSEFLEATLFIFLLHLGIYLILLSREALEARGMAFTRPRLSWMYVIVSGLLFGFAFISRAEALPVILVVSVWFFWDLIATRKERGDTPSPNVDTISHPRGRDFSLPFILRLLVCFLLSFFIPVIPLTIHNIKQGHDFVLVTSQGGLNFFIGNQPWSGGWCTVLPGVEIPTSYDDIHTIRFLYGPDINVTQNKKPSEISRYYYRKALREIAQDPRASFLLFLRKAVLFWNDREIPGNLDPYFFSREFSHIIKPLHFLSFGVILPFACAALYFIACKGSRKGYLLILMIAVFWFMNIAYFTTSRHRLAAVTLVIILAGHGAVELWRLFSTSRKGMSGLLKGHIPLWLLILAGLLLPRFPFPEASQFLHGSYFNLGYVEQKKANYPQAEHYYRKALQIYPNYIQAKKNLGLVYRLMNRPEEAYELWRSIDIQQPYYPDINEFLGNIMMENRNWQEAADYFKKEITLRQDSADLWYKLGYVLLQMNKKDEGVSALKRSLELSPADNPAQFLLQRSDNADSRTINSD